MLVYCAYPPHKGVFREFMFKEIHPPRNQLYVFRRIPLVRYDSVYAGVEIFPTATVLVVGHYNARYCTPAILFVPQVN